MPKKLTHEQFLKKLWEKNEHYKSGKFAVVGEYKNSRCRITVEDKWGRLLVSPTILLGGTRPSIITAIDKTQYFKNKLYSKNRYYREGDFKVIGEYIDNSLNIFVENKYGVLLVRRAGLLAQTSNLSVIKAVDKIKYWIAMAKEVHGAVYDYSNTEYKTSSSKVIIGCRQHGNFTQKPSSHIFGNGCPTCAKQLTPYRFSDWSKMCSGNPGIFYILRCWNEEEEFYKVGITCNSIQERYHTKKRLPYSYEVIKEYVDSDRQVIWDMEKEYIKSNKKYHYKPNIRFGGSSNECFKIKFS